MSAVETGSTARLAEWFGEKPLIPEVMENLAVAFSSIGAEIEDQLQALPWEVTRTLSTFLEFLAQGKIEELRQWIIETEAARRLLEFFGPAKVPGSVSVFKDLYEKAEHARETMQETAVTIHEAIKSLIDAIVSEAIVEEEAKMIILQEEEEEQTSAKLELQDMSVVSGTGVDVVVDDGIEHFDEQSRLAKLRMRAQRNIIDFWERATDNFGSFAIGVFAHVSAPPTTIDPAKAMAV